MLFRKYLKLEKPILNIKQRGGRFIGVTEFQGEKLLIKGKTWAGVRDALGDKMTIMIEAMDQYKGKKKKRGTGKIREEKKNVEKRKREKLIKKLAREGY